MLNPLSTQDTYKPMVYRLIIAVKKRRIEVGYQFYHFIIWLYQAGWEDYMII